MKIKPYKSVREAYDAVHKREKTFAMFKGLSEDEANRHAAKNAVKWAWIEFNIYQEIANGKK